MSLPERLRALRVERDLTQADLARRVGVAQPMISRLESGTAAPSVRMLQKLAQALGVTTTDLLDTGVALDRRTWPKALTEFIDDPLSEVLKITPREVAALASIELPWPTNKDGYAHLLLCIRNLPRLGEGVTKS